jgi:TRIAD3 protein (E3 ubiquitin-protein ligase RNF216)
MINKIPAKLLARVTDAEAAQLIADLELDGVKKCAHCGCPFQFEGFGLMRCPICGFATCSKCEGPWHEGPCPRLDPRHKAEEEATSQLIAICPNCEADLFREGGCNLMKCPNCHTMMCDFCHQIIPADVNYGHFWARPGEVCPANACPLWTEALQMARSERANRLAAAKGG